MNAWRRNLVVIGLALPVVAHACGACVEDTVAATYDHAIVERAATQGKVLVYTSIDGAGDAAVLAKRAADAARHLGGVDRASVRVSAAPLALSFAIDPKTLTVDGAIAGVQQRGRNQGLRLSVVRVVP